MKMLVAVPLECPIRNLVYLGIPALCKYLLSGVKWSELETLGFFCRRHLNAWVGMQNFLRYLNFNRALFGKIMVLGLFRQEFSNYRMPF